MIIKSTDDVDTHVTSLWLSVYGDDNKSPVSEAGKYQRRSLPLSVVNIDVTGPATSRIGPLGCQASLHLFISFTIQRKLFPGPTFFQFVAATVIFRKVDNVTFD